MNKKFIEILIQEKIKKLDEAVFKTNLCFLKSVNGLRPSTMSMVMAPTGSGKSTFTRQIIVDFLISNPKEKLALYLSEETVEAWQIDFYRIVRDYSLLERINFYSELDCKNSVEINEVLNNFLNDQSKVLVLDNITTARFYETKKPSEQSDLIGKLKSVSHKNGKALVTVTHTSSGIDTRMKDLYGSSNVRGSKTISNIMDFIYILYQIEENSERHSFVYLEKSRGQLPGDKIYKLVFNPKSRCYERDIPIDFETFKNIFKNRDKL